MNQANQLHRFLDTRLMAVQCELSSPKKLLQEMARLLSLPLLDACSEKNIEKEVYHCLLEREKIGNTGIGNGVALPHSRCLDTGRAIIGLITLKNAIDYDSPDGQPVDIAFGLIVPQDATQEHLNLLAEIARMMSDNNRKQALLAAESAEQMMDLISAWSTPDTQS